jgi:hypothetical protein
MEKPAQKDWNLNSIEQRRCGRKRFSQILPTASCETLECDFMAPVCDISSNGAFIRTSHNFKVGQEVAMKITFPTTRETHLVTGEVVRVSPEGVGVEFRIFFHKN